MNGAVIVLFSLGFLVCGYLFWGRRLSRRLDIGDTPTPAHTMRDGVDYVPAKTPVLLGHHFASIAGAAPIVGPVLAAGFGWVPALLWVLIGSVFIGAVHDFTAMVASVRHKGGTVGMIINEHLGAAGRTMFLIFSWITLVLVICVFTVIVADTFVIEPSTATSSLLFMVLAVAFGFSTRSGLLGLLPATLLGIAGMVLALWLGLVFPFPEVVAGKGMKVFWEVVLLVYVYIASVTPVNLLLQPRDYLSSFLLYAVMILCFVAMMVGAPAIQLPAFTGFSSPAVGPVFPMLFVTVACGAISGFHALVSSGTSSKQLDRERDALPVAYGAMLVEAMVAVLAIGATAALGWETFTSLLKSGGPVYVFSTSMGGLADALGLPAGTGAAIINLAVSAFALTSLDTATRIGRFSVQELCGGREATGNPVKLLLAKNRHAATAVTVAGAVLMLLSGDVITRIWQLFGTANQLLAAIALMAATAWLSKLGKKTAFLRIPMYFMFTVTLGALGLKAWDAAFGPKPDLLLLAMSVLLGALALVLGRIYLKRPR